MAKLSAREVVNDIRSGMDDTALMQKYQVSAQGLRIQFRKLLDMGAITQAELSNRSPASDKTMVMAWKCPACGKPQAKEVAECPDCGIIVSKFLKRRKPDKKPIGEASPQRPPGRGETSGQANEGLSNGKRKKTGLLRNCPVCGKPHPKDLESCPDCGVIFSKVMAQPEIKQRSSGSLMHRVREYISGSDIQGRMEVLTARFSERYPRGQEGLLRFWRTRKDVVLSALRVVALTVALLVPIGYVVVYYTDLTSSRTDTDEEKKGLFQACEEGDVGVVKSLLRKGVPVDVRDSMGSTPLITAALAGSVDVVKLLLAKGANIEARDAMVGHTPLMHAASAGRFDVVMLLLAKGAKVNATDKIDKTATWWASHNGHTEIAKFLRNRGGN